MYIVEGHDDYIIYKMSNIYGNFKINFSLSRSPCSWLSFFSIFSPYRHIAVALDGPSYSLTCISSYSELFWCSWWNIDTNHITSNIYLNKIRMPNKYKRLIFTVFFFLYSRFSKCLWLMFCVFRLMFAVDFLIFNQLNAYFIVWKVSSWNETTEM